MEIISNSYLSLFAQFVSTYGAHEEIVEAKEVNYEGVVTRMGKRINVKEKPKISPYLLSVLLDMTIFLRLDEIKMPSELQLPDYEEVIDLVDMEKELLDPYIDYLGTITSQLRKNKALLGNLATDAIAIPDMPFMPRNAQGCAYYEPTTDRETFGMTNKEKRLVENVKAELNEGRNCIVYLTFTNQVVATDITKILSEAFPHKTIKFLPSTVNPRKRKEWIAKNECDVLICNPELVKTGLTLLQFPTIIFYETTYNLFTLKQASRRSWRIGQDKNVKVIFMAYKNTPQHKALELIGAKVAAANSLEGRLSGEDDLSSMGEDDDNIQLALAKAILSGESSSEEIKTTSIKNFGGDRDWDAFEAHYMQMMESFKDIEPDNKDIATELIENAAQNEKDGISIHDGHGGNWGSALAEVFGIQNNPNFVVCSMPKKDTDAEMYKRLSEDVLEIHHNGKLYGRKKFIVNEKGKEQTAMSYAGGSHCFDRCSEYNNGLTDGLSYNISRTEDYMPIGIEIYRVKNGIAPYEPVSGSKVLLPISSLEEFISRSNSVEELAQSIMTFYDSAAKQETQQPALDSLLDYDGSTTFVYYEGKGRNQKRIEVDAANLADYIPQEKRAGGIQLSLF